MRRKNTPVTMLLLGLVAVSSAGGAHALVTRDSPAVAASSTSPAAVTTARASGPPSPVLPVDADRDRTSTAPTVNERTPAAAVRAFAESLTWYFGSPRARANPTDAAASVLSPTAQVRPALVAIHRGRDASRRRVSLDLAGGSYRVIAQRHADDGRLTGVMCELVITQRRAGGARPWVVGGVMQFEEGRWVIAHVQPARTQATSLDRLPVPTVGSGWGRMDAR